MGLGRNKYVNTPVGSTAIISASAAKDIEEFQAVVAELESIEADGGIVILERRQESQTGKRHIAVVRFERLR